MSSGLTPKMQRAAPLLWSALFPMTKGLRPQGLVKHFFRIECAVVDVLSDAHIKVVK